MVMPRPISARYLACLLVLDLLALVLWGWRPSQAAFSDFSSPVTSHVSAPKASRNIAYVGKSDLNIEVVTFLTVRGYTVTMVPTFNVINTDFSPFDLVVIGDDTGLLNDWGETAGDVAKITAPNKPIVGIGEGGYAFFGKMSLYLGWPHGWHGPVNTISRTVTAPTMLFSNPNAVIPNPIQAFTQPVNEVAIYINPNLAPPADVVVMGYEPPFPSVYDHSNLIGQGCRYLWGFSGGPSAMTLDGQNLFDNLITFALGTTCLPPPPLPNDQCLTVSKNSNPPNLSPVSFGSSIVYTLTVLNSTNQACPGLTATLADRVPTGTIPIGLGGGTLAQDNAILWDIQPSGALQTRVFTVTTSLAACWKGGVITNQARYGLTNAPSILSNSIFQMVNNCPAVIYQLFLPLLKR